MKDRNQVFEDFLKDNPKFVAGHHRQLADWSFDTKYRDQVASGDMSFSEALIKARDEALETLPPSHEKTQTITGLTGYDAAIAQMAIGRNQPIPPPSGHIESPPGLVALITARSGGFKTEED
jgi:hypothetical protein